MQSGPIAPRAFNVKHPSVVEASRMATDSTKVIVTTSGSSTTTCVHHRDFPEIRVEAGSAREAAAHLVNKLAAALDSALTDWRRQTLNQAVADVQAFLDQP
jgi:hypothetical protein